MKKLKLFVGVGTLVFSGGLQAEPVSIVNNTHLAATVARPAHLSQKPATEPKAEEKGRPGAVESVREYSDKQMNCTVQAMMRTGKDGSKRQITPAARTVRASRKDYYELMKCVQSGRSSKANIACWMKVAQTAQPQVGSAFMGILSECGKKAKWDQKFSEGTVASAYEDSVNLIPPKLLAMRCKDSCMNSPLVAEPCFQSKATKDVVRTCRTRVHYCNQLSPTCADNRSSWDYNWRTAYYSWMAAENTLNRLQDREARKKGESTVTHQWPVEQGVQQDMYRFLVRSRKHHGGKGNYFTVDVLEKGKDQRFYPVGSTGPLLKEADRKQGNRNFNHYRANLSSAEGTKQVSFYKEADGNFCTVQLSWKEGLAKETRAQRAYRARGKCPTR